MPEPRANVMVQMPLALKVQLEEFCEGKKVPVAGFVRKLVADAVGFTLSPITIGRARKYATVEERIAEQKKRDKKRRALTKILLEKYANGEISIDDILGADVAEDEDSA